MTADSKNHPPDVQRVHPIRIATGSSGWKHTGRLPVTEPGLDSGTGKAAPWTDTQSSGTSRVRKDDSGPTVVRAPMPGTVIELHRGVGDPVSTGDLMLILEAMKMRNRIYAPASGVITAIHTGQGRNVKRSDPLMVIGKEKPVDPVSAQSSEPAMTSAKPLAGIRVLDLSHVLAMPYATMILADLGAEVIKIERPGQGDDARRFGPFIKGESGYFMSVNRNKLSVELNLKHARGREILADLIKQSDVITENYRPGTMAKLGFSYEAIKALNPKIIYATVCGFGHDSVYPERPGYDIVAQAFGGLMSITGYPDSPPTRVGTSAADIFSGLFTAIGILGALRTVERTDESERLDIAMSDCVMAVLENAVARYTLTGNIPARVGSRHPSLTPFDVFRTVDGYIVIAAGNDNLWKSLCRGIPELSDMLNDPRFESNELRTEHHATIKERLESWTQSQSSQEAAAAVAETGVPCSPVNTVDQVVNDPNTAHRRMLLECEHPVAGHLRTANTPIAYSVADCKTHRPAPLLGEHTEHVLTAILGYTREEIEALRTDGAL